MSVKVTLNQVFFEYTGNREVVEVKGSTVKECLDYLTGLFPGLRGMLFDDENKLSALVALDNEIIPPNGLSRPVKATSELSIRPLIYGG